MNISEFSSDIVAQSKFMLSRSVQNVQERSCTLIIKSTKDKMKRYWERWFWLISKYIVNLRVQYENDECWCSETLYKSERFCSSIFAYLWESLLWIETTHHLFWQWMSISKQCLWDWFAEWVRVIIKQIS